MDAVADACKKPLGAFLLLVCCAPCPLGPPWHLLGGWWTPALPLCTLGATAGEDLLDAPCHEHVAHLYGWKRGVALSELAYWPRRQLWDLLARHNLGATWSQHHAYVGPAAPYSHQDADEPGREGIASWPHTGEGRGGLDAVFLLGLSVMSKFCAGSRGL